MGSRATGSKSPPSHSGCPAIKGRHSDNGRLAVTPEAGAWPMATGTSTQQAQAGSATECHQLVPVPLTGSGIMTRMDDRDAGEGLGGYVGQAYAELPTVTWSLGGIMMTSCRGGAGFSLLADRDRGHLTSQR